MLILGISAYYHDSAAALLRDGVIVAAAQEERFSRKKHDPRFPRHAIEFCLTEAGIGLKDVDLVAFYDKPFLKFERLLETYLAFAPLGFRSFAMAMPIWLREKLFLKSQLMTELKSLAGSFNEERLKFSEHHLSHAASAFYPSPFEEAAILIMDGVGEWATTSLANGKGNQISVVKEIHFPHSLGLLYSAFTYHTGFTVNSGEYKLMGLAPYGEPKYAALIHEHLIDVKQDGSFRLSMAYFDYCTGLTMTSPKFDALFGPRRAPEAPFSQHHMDMAASVQTVIEDVILKLTRAIRAETDQQNLCLAGGVALNCVANGKVLRDNKFQKIWIQPAAGDAGGAVGAALATYHMYAAQPRHVLRNDAMSGAYLGPSYITTDIAARLTAAGGVLEILDDAALLDTTAADLAEGRAVGWFQGRMEFGPRALGNRSILGDPRSATMQRTLNLRVKFRESFRPFAPSVLREDAAEWFDLDADSPYMLLVADVLPNRRCPISEADRQLFGIDKLNVVRSEIPAITHVDYSARIQTVDRDINPRFHQLLTAFKARTGCPVLINTSFNVRGEPIVCSPEDAFRCFMGTDIESLVIGNCYLRKDNQRADLRRDYRNAFERD